MRSAPAAMSALSTFSVPASRPATRACNLCVYPCPTDCIVMTPEYEFAERDKTNFLYRFAKDKPTPPAPPEEKKEAEPVAAG